MVPCLVAVESVKVKKTGCIQWIITKADDKGHAVLELVGLSEVTQYASIII